MPPTMQQESEWSSDEEPPFRNPLLASVIRSIQGSSREEHKLQLQALRHVMERHILKVRGNCGNAMDELEEVKEKGANIELRKKRLASMQELLQDSTDVCNAMLEFLKRECGANWEQREPAVAERVCLESDDETVAKPKKERRRRPAKTWITRVHKPRNKKPPGELSEVEKDS